MKKRGFIVVIVFLLSLFYVLAQPVFPTSPPPTPGQENTADPTLQDLNNFPEQNVLPTDELNTAQNSLPQNNGLSSQDTLPQDNNIPSEANQQDIYYPPDTLTTNELNTAQDTLPADNSNSLQETNNAHDSQTYTEPPTNNQNQIENQQSSSNLPSNSPANTENNDEQLLQRSTESNLNNVEVSDATSVITEKPFFLQSKLMLIIVILGGFLATFGAGVLSGVFISHRKNSKTEQTKEKKEITFHTQTQSPMLSAQQQVPIALLNYIRSNLSRGYTDSQLKIMLLRGGWPESTILRAINHAHRKYN